MFRVFDIGVTWIKTGFFSRLSRLARAALILAGTGAGLTNFGWILRGDLIEGRAPWGWMIALGMFLGVAGGILWLIDLGAVKIETPRSVRRWTFLLILFAESPVVFFVLLFMLAFGLSTG